MISENEKITRVDIETTMKTAYIDYAMSVIVSSRFNAAYSMP